MSKKNKIHRTSEATSALYYITLEPATHREKKDLKMHKTASLPYWVSIGKLTVDDVDDVKNDDDVKNMELIQVGEYPSVGLKYKLDAKNRDESLDKIFYKLYISGYLLDYHRIDNYDDDETIDDSSLFTAFLDILGVKKNKEKIYKDIFEDKYFNVFKEYDIEEAKEIVANFMNFEKKSKKRGFLESIMEKCEGYENKVKELHEEINKTEKFPNPDKEMQENFISSLKSKFHEAKKFFQKLMSKLVLRLLSVCSELKDVFDPKNLLESVGKIILRWLDVVVSNLEKKWQKKEVVSTFKSEKVESDSDLTWFHFTQLALQEVYSILDMDNVLRSRERSSNDVVEVAVAHAVFAERQKKNQTENRLKKIALILDLKMINSYDINIKKSGKIEDIERREELLVRFQKVYISLGFRPLSDKKVKKLLKAVQELPKDANQTDFNKLKNILYGEKKEMTMKNRFKSNVFGRLVDKTSNSSDDPYEPSNSKRIKAVSDNPKQTRTRIIIDEEEEGEMVQSLFNLTT